jgi:hypothetical protein
MARKKAKPKALVSAFFEAYRGRWADRYGHPYVDRIGIKQVAAVAELVKAIDIRDLVGAVGYFVADENPWLREHGHPLNYFLKYPNKYVGRELGQDKSGRRAEEERARKAKQAEKELDAFERTLGG